MDSITHVVLGGGIQIASMGKIQGRKAIIYGAVLATLPDLDVFSIRTLDPILTMTTHRGFTHSLFVLTILAYLLTFVIRRYYPNPDYSSKRLFITTWLVLITHPLLDSLTVYGTQLFWPLHFTPASWPAVFIVDPLFTLPLLVIFIAALFYQKFTQNFIKLTYLALIWCVVYLAFGTVNRLMAEHQVETLLTKKGEEIIEIKATPLPLNNIIWRVLAKTNHDQYYEVIINPYDNQIPEMQLIPIHSELVNYIKDSYQYQQLKWFTGNWLRYDIVDQNLIISDLRMGISGILTFKFIIAKKDTIGNWEIITPQKFSDYGLIGDSGTQKLLPYIFPRILGKTVIPLQNWIPPYFLKYDEK